MPVEKKAEETVEEVELFEWKCKNGTTIHLPSLDTMDPDLEALEMLAQVRKSGNALLSLAQQTSYLVNAFPEYEDQLRQVRMSEFADFQTAWAKFSGVELGE